MSFRGFFFEHIMCREHKVRAETTEIDHDTTLAHCPVCGIDETIGDISRIRSLHVSYAVPHPEVVSTHFHPQ